MLLVTVAEQAVDLAEQPFRHDVLSAIRDDLRTKGTCAYDSGSNEGPHLRAKDAVNRAEEKFDDVAEHNAILSHHLLICQVDVSFFWDVGVVHGDIQICTNVFFDFSHHVVGCFAVWKRQTRTDHKKQVVTMRQLV